MMYDSEKTRYDAVVHKLQNEYQGLEAESSRLQEELVEKERQYQLICDSNEALADCSDVEDMSNFETKANEQEAYIDELQNQLRSIKENEAYSEVQKRMFVDLIKLFKITMMPTDSSLDYEEGDFTDSNEIKISNWTI
jgi:Skp family chaperone for outer membrane proteins